MTKTELRQAALAVLRAADQRPPDQLIERLPALLDWAAREVFLDPGLEDVQPQSVSTVREALRHQDRVGVLPITKEAE